MRAGASGWEAQNYEADGWGPGPDSYPPSRPEPVGGSDEEWEAWAAAEDAISDGMVERWMP